MSWTYTLAQLAEAIGAVTDAPDAVFSSVSTDTRTLKPGDLFVALSGENFDGSTFVKNAFEKGACAAVTTATDDAGPCLVVNDAQTALQKFAAWHRTQHTLPLLALTGSCGKTTTKDLAAAVLGSKYRIVKTQGNLNNEIGCPMSLLQIDGETDMAVIEMGANHKEEIANLCALARPTEAGITLIAPAHLEGFGSIENVAKAKAEIVESLPPDGTYYVNVDNVWCAQIAESYEGRKVWFGSTGDVALESCEMLGERGMRLRVAPVGELELPLFCRSHASNVLLAIAVGLEHGITEFEGPLREACAASSRFKLLRVGPLEIIDDTYNANPASMAAALHALAEWPATGNRMAAVGDMLELGESASELHREVGELAGRLNLARLWARGEFSGDVADGAKSAGLASAEAVDEHRAIAEAIHAAAGPGDVLLVKGSRGMKMECVIDALRELFG